MEERLWVAWTAATRTCHGSIDLLLTCSLLPVHALAGSPLFCFARCSFSLALLVSPGSGRLSALFGLCVARRLFWGRRALTLHCVSHGS